MTAENVDHTIIEELPNQCCLLHLKKQNSIRYSWPVVIVECLINLLLIFISLLVIYPDHRIDRHPIRYHLHHPHEATITKNHHVQFTSTSIALDQMRKIRVLKMTPKHRPTIIVSSKKNQIPHHKRYTIRIK